MNRNVPMSLVRLKTTVLRLITALSLVAAACVMSPAQSSPQVHLDADGLAPRPIEELTGTAIAHYYALAWNHMTAALESSRMDGLDESFVGFAKERLKQRIAGQQETGIHIRIVDHGHQLKAIFYATDGTVMQLSDKAQLEIQTFDGAKLIDTQNAPRDYIVLMTPGADRWYVRDLEEVSSKPSE